MNINKLSDIFQGQVPGLNKPVDFEDVAETKRQKFEKLPELNFQSGLKMNTNMKDKIFGNIEKHSWNRMKNQKGLTLFGDWDKDKTLNIFDCDPKDFLKQARVHKELEVYNTAPLPPVNPNAPAPKITWKEKLGIKSKVAYQDLKEGGNVAVQESKDYVKQAPKSLWLGITKPIRDDQQKRKDIQELKAAVREGELKRIKSGNVATINKYLGRQQRPVKDVTGAIQQGVTPFGFGQSQSLLSEGEKMSRLLGIKEDHSYKIGVAVGQNQYGDQQYPTQQVSQVQGQVPQQGQQTSQPQSVYSERSKRPVSYKRGPYRKTRVVQYVPPQQQQRY